MMNFRCTNKVIQRCGLIKEKMESNAPSRLMLGDWYCTMIEIDGRNAFVFMSEVTFLSFIMLEGKRMTPENLSLCLVAGLEQLLEREGFKQQHIDTAVFGMEEGCFCGVEDLSITSVLTNIATNYQWRIETVGGLNYCDVGKVIQGVNSVPRKKLGYTSSLDKTKELLTGSRERTRLIF